MKKENYWRIGTAAFVISSIAGTYFLSGPKNRKKKSEVYKAQQETIDENLTVPANATFALVWPIIYAGTIALAIHQALPSQTDNPRYRKAAPWLVLSYVLNGIFGYFFADPDKRSRISAGITTLLHLPVALTLHQRLGVGEREVQGPEKFFQKSISLYAGWLTAASVVSAGNLLIEGGIHVKAKNSVIWSVGVLSATAALGAFSAKKLNDPVYLTPLIVAFAGVALKQYERHRPVSLVAGAEGLALAAWLGKLWQEKNTSPTMVSSPTTFIPVWEFSDN